jgi:hypothetical protein
MQLFTSTCRSYGTCKSIIIIFLPTFRPDGTVGECGKYLYFPGRIETLIEQQNKSSKAIAFKKLSVLTEVSCETLYDMIIKMFGILTFLPFNSQA